MNAVPLRVVLSVGLVLLALNDLILVLVLRRGPAPAEGRVEAPDVGGDPAGPASRTDPATADLQRRIAALETAAARAPEGAAAAPAADDPAPAALQQALLEKLRASKSGTAATHLRRLVELGDAAVAGIAAELGRANLADYGGGAVINNTNFLAYPSERIALLDALRLIDTDAAHQALSAAIGELRDPGEVEYAIVIAEDYESGPVADAARDAVIRALENGDASVPDRWSLAEEILRGRGVSGFAGDPARAARTLILIEGLFEDMKREEEMSEWAREAVVEGLERLRKRAR